MRNTLISCIALATCLGFAPIATPAQAPILPARTIRPTLATAPVSKDPDDPAIWIDRRSPARSLVIGTNKIKAADGGALYVFDLNGKIRQIVADLDRPNNVDVEYGFRLGNRRLDIVVTTERLQHRLRIFGIDPRTGRLSDLAPRGLPVFAGATGEASEPMGIALYKRPQDGRIFAVVGRKSGPPKGYLGLYELRDNGQGTPEAVALREFGAYSGKKEIEAIAVDDALGYVYYADETVCLRKYAVDLENPYFGQELATFGRTEFQADHEGIALYTRPDGTGYLVCTDQIPAAQGGTRYYVYRREGEPGNRHDHTHPVRVVNGGADETDGIEVTATPLGPRFPHGLFAAMNSGPKNFLFYDAGRLIPATE